MVVAGKGYFPMEFNQPPKNTTEFCYLPILRREQQMYREYYAFWRADTVKDYIEPFAAILHRYFPKEAQPVDFHEEKNL